MTQVVVFMTVWGAQEIPDTVNTEKTQKSFSTSKVLIRVQCEHIQRTL